MRHHLIISGTGRAGTTFLMQLFTALGLDTGYKSPDEGLFPNCNAGMERDIRDPNCPYIVKGPNMCDYLDGFLSSGEGQGVTIDHAIIPMRDLYSAAASRRFVTANADREAFPGEVPGGLWKGTEKGPVPQEVFLAERFYELIYCLTKWSIPVTFLRFPYFIGHPSYLHDNLLEPLKGHYGTVMFSVGWYGNFKDAFNRVAKPHLIHTF